MKGWAIRKVTNPGMASPEEEIMLEFTTTQIEGEVADVLGACAA